MVAQPFESAPELPISFRGYSREAIDAFLERIEEGYVHLIAEREDLQRRLEELQRELTEHREREHLVSEALVRAERIASEMKAAAHVQVESEREELAAVKERTLSEAEAILAQARAKAEAIVQEAREQAVRTQEELLAEIADQQDEAARLLDDTRERLASLVTELIKQLPVGTAGRPNSRPRLR